MIPGLVTTGHTLPRFKAVAERARDVSAGRLAEMDAHGIGLPRSLTDACKAHIYVTPSGMLNLPHFKFIHEVLGAERLLCAVDHPDLTNTGARRFIENLPASDEDKSKIAHGNAEALLRM